jgi:type VI secretion system secreted protein VgrG
MNNRIQSFRLGIASGLSLLFAALATFATPANAQSLGTAENFAVLGASTVTSAGVSNISGSVGVSPGTSITGFPPGIITNGDLNMGDATATQAHADLATAYNGFAGLISPIENNLSGTDLGGQTLTRGVYHYDTSANSAGILTFDAQNDPTARFVVQIGTTLITSAGSSVVLINGADAGNIYFQVGTSVTLGAGSNFIGNILANVSITGSGATVTGRLLAVTAAVTLDTNNVTVPPPVVIHVAPVVTNTNDSGPDSLRQALVNAENGDTITFEIPTSDPGYNAGIWTIGLTTSELVIDKDVTIAGLGANVLTVQKAPFGEPFRIFNVSPGHSVTIKGLTISNGEATGSLPDCAGGGIYNDHSNLEVDSCTLSGNTSSSDSFGGGGIYNDGSGSVNSNGNASLTVVNSTLSGNSAYNGYGGAISNNGVGGNASVTVIDSTLSGNSVPASQFGGSAIDNDGDNAPVTVISSTLSGNSGAATIVNFGTLTIGNTILDADVSGPTIDFGSDVTSLGYNLSSDISGGLLNETGDQVNTDPMLGPLKNNGGPTMTHAPLSNSSAIDRGKDIGGTQQDQRGSVRPANYNDPSIVIPTGGDGSDIGAVELQPGVLPTSADSWKTHGETPFPINLPLRGTIVGIECRSGGATGDYQIILNFAQPVTYSSATLTSGTGSVVGVTLGAPSKVAATKESRRSKVASINSGTQVVIELTGVENAQIITLALFDVSDGVNIGDIGIRIGVLLGDVNGDGVVLSGDYTAARAMSGTSVDASTFQFDVNTDGSILSGDFTIVRKQSGTHLP